MDRRYTIKLSVYDKSGSDEWHMAVDSEELPIFSERFVDEMKAGLAFSGPTALDQAVKVLKKREFRRDRLRDAARKLAERMADYIEDSEGWHGDRRRELIKDQR